MVPKNNAAPITVVVVLANALNSGKFFTLARVPQAYEKDAKQTKKPPRKLEDPSDVSRKPIATIPPRIANITPLTKVNFIFLLSKATSKIAANAGNEAAATATVTGSVNA